MGELAPEIDFLVSQLPVMERQIVILRFFLGHSHVAVARQLRLTPEATRKRCDRALEKLRILLNKRGIAATSSALASLLPAHAVGSVPAGLASATASVALVSAPTAVSAFSILRLILMKISTKITIVAITTAAVIGTAVFMNEKGVPSSSASQAASPVNRLPGGSGNAPPMNPPPPGKRAGSPKSARGADSPLSLVCRNSKQSYPRRTAKRVTSSSPNTFPTWIRLAFDRRLAT